MAAHPQPPEPVEHEATYQDVLAAPEHRIAEIIDGELLLSPRPALPHARAGSRMNYALGSFDQPSGGGPERPGGWWILYEPELHFGRQVLVPDLAGWRRERLPVLPDSAFAELAPDWVCEIVSPASARIDRVYKRRIYATVAVRHLWLVDPRARTLEVFRLDGAHWSLIATHADCEKVRAEPFDAVELDLAEWWLPEVGATPESPLVKSPVGP